jgi:hypothetical protein
MGIVPPGDHYVAASKIKDLPFPRVFTKAAQSRGRPENLRFCTRKFVEIHVPESRECR